MYLIDLARNVNAKIIYSVGPHCTNLSPQQPMHNYRLDQSEAHTILYTAYTILRESGYSGPVVIDVVDTDAYVRAAIISQKLPGMLCIDSPLPYCIVQVHCFTVCDANSGFYVNCK